jgi:hypothetical protein
MIIDKIEMENRRDKEIESGITGGGGRKIDGAIGHDEGSRVLGRRENEEEKC